MNENTSSPRVSLAGSERQVLPNAQALGPVNPDELIQASIYLRKKTQSDLDQVIQQQVAGLRQPLTREEYAATYGADPADVQVIEDFARQQHLSIGEVSLARGVVVVKGTAAAMSAAFGANLQRYELQGTTYRGRSGPLSLPAHLQGIITAVLGIDDRPQAQPFIKRPAATATGISYTPLQVAHLYDFPMIGKGAGQTIALIELGGGYRDTDIATYFQQLGLTAPNVVSVSVDGAQNAPTTAKSADSEVALDIEVAGAVAPGARIVVYFAPNTDAGFLDAITTAIHDTTSTPSVISISWGSAEMFWTAQSLQAMNQAFQAAAALGITVFCAAGDFAALDFFLDVDELLHVSFPASSPYVLACGGTKLTSANGQITQEIVWNESALSATGGGISDVFALPSWQKEKQIPPSINPDHRVGRGVPDVAGNADPSTGYQILVDGQASVLGGTSAVAPLWAGLVALLNEQLGKPLGYLNPVLYQLENVGAFHDITEGDNRILKGDSHAGYSARPGWDACTGLGTPNGTKLFSVLSDRQANVVAAPARAIQLSKLTMITQRSGWSLSANSLSHIYRTQHGPEHWSDVTPPLLTKNPQTTITSSYFPDAARGYLGVAQGSTDLLLHTNDGGKTWQTTSFSIQSGFFLYQIVFLDAQHGWLSFGSEIGLKGESALVLMQTSDGGKTWHTILESPKNPSGLSPAFFQSTRFTFIDQQNGWATGMNPSGSVYLYRTHDGGKTWSQVNVPSIMGGISFMQSYGPYWQSGHSGTVYVHYTTNAGQGYKGLAAYQTHDGGQSWTPGPASPALGSTDLYTFSFLNAQQGWSFGFDGQGQDVIHHTSTSGWSWELIHPTGLLKPDSRNQAIGDLSFLNASTGWVFIKDSKNNWNLFQSENGGHSWHALHPQLG